MVQLGTVFFICLINCLMSSSLVFLYWHLGPYIYKNRSTRKFIFVFLIYVRSYSKLLFKLYLYGNLYVSSGFLVYTFLLRTLALYHQSFMGAYNTIGQEAWYSALAKRPRYESASNLPIYPQRPGEKDCAHYMLTRTCKFGELCKFDHPIWVPEGGIPDWKEVTV